MKPTKNNFFQLVKDNNQKELDKIDGIPTLPKKPKPLDIKEQPTLPAIEEEIRNVP